jgi:hypothetical protein
MGTCSVNTYSSALGQLDNTNLSVLLFLIARALSLNLCGIHKRLKGVQRCEKYPILQNVSVFFKKKDWIFNTRTKLHQAIFVLLDGLLYPFPVTHASVSNG